MTPLLVLCGLPVLTVTGNVMLIQHYIRTLQKASLRDTFRAIAILVVWCAFITLISTPVAGANWFGMPMSMLSPFIVIPLYLMKLLRLNPLAYDRAIVTVISLVIAGIVWLTPLWGFFAVENVCSAWNHRLVAPVIAAAQSYYQSNGDYPDALNQLVPEYLPAVPALPCRIPSRLIAPLFSTTSSTDITNYPDVTLEHCRNNPLISFQSASGTSEERYLLKEDRWDSVGWDAGVCSYLN